MNQRERHFHEELKEVNDLLKIMNKMVLNIFDQTVESFLSRDPVTARRLLDERGEIDSLELSIEEKCLSMIALHQPVAIDLRNIVTAINVIRDLERIDDISMDICHNTIYLSKLKGEYSLGNIGIRSLAANVKEMVHNAVHSFINRDKAEALEVCRFDDVVDDAEIEVQDAVIALIESDAKMARPGFYFSSTAKQLERIGDHCTNIAEMVIYLTQAIIIKHHNVPDYDG